MRRSNRSTLLAGITVLYAVTATAASQPPETFAQQFIAAINSKNPDRRLEVIHPATRACITPKTQPYYDWIFSHQARLVTAGDYKAAAVPFTQTALPTDGHSDYPLRPTHQLQIDFGDQTRAATLLLFIARDGDQWREVLPCPRDDAVAQAQAKQLEAQQRAQKVEGLIRNMPAALRAEIVALLKEGRKVDAIKRYAAATNEDLSMAKGVIESLR